MTTNRRRAILTAICGAFAQGLRAQKKEGDVLEGLTLDHLKLHDNLVVLTLSVKSKGEKVTGILINYNDEAVEISMKDLMAAVQPVKPKPNQCPVCGTMAAPIKYVPPSPCDLMTPGGLAGGLVCFTSNTPRPSQNLIRCKNCNAAFWQDYE